MNDKIVLVSKKDLIIEWFNGSGAGGQYRNKHANCCRLTHPASGVTTQGTKQRDQPQNRKDAFNALVAHPTFRMWLAARLLEINTGETVESRVERAMRPHNLLVEGINEQGQWEELE